MNKQFFKNVITFFLLILAIPSWAELISRVDRTEIGANETLQFTLRYTGQAVSGEPNLKPLEQSFEIISTSRQQQYSWVNGAAKSSTDWKILLLPKRQGAFTIPQLSFKGETSKAISVLVKPNQTGSAATADQPVFIETSIDKSSAYIQEQIILTHRLHYSVQLQDISISDFKIPDALIQQIAEQRFTQRIGNKNYTIIELKFALFPQAAGKLTIPAQRFTAYETSGSQFGGFFSRGNRLMRVTEEKSIDILPRPIHVSINNWMPSKGIKLSEKWSNNSNTLTTGEPITRTIIISANGLTAAQIQPLPLIDDPAFKIYPDQAELVNNKTNQGIVGTRSQSIAIVPNSTGQITLPVIEIKWWDTQNNRLQTSRLPSRTFSVIASKNIPQNSRENGINVASEKQLNLSNTDSQPLAIIRWSLSLNALLIVAIIGLFYWKRRPLPKSVTPKAEITGARQYLKQIKSQASEDKLSAMRNSLLLWGAEVFPQQPPRSLNQLALLMNNPILQEQLNLLDQHLFKAEIDKKIAVDTSGIIQKLKSYVPEKNTANGQFKNLRSLYPTGDSQ